MEKHRNAHESSKGRKAKKRVLADLSREMPTEDEILSYQTLLDKESDRGAVVMAGAYVETALFVAINASIVDPGDAVTKNWFEGPNAPFGTFAAKIALGRAVGIYGVDMEGRLTTIKNIRNQFAHAPRPLDFDSDVVAVACKKLLPDDQKYERLPARRAYVAACLALGQVLIQYSLKAGGREVKPHFS